MPKNLTLLVVKQATNFMRFVMAIVPSKRCVGQLFCAPESGQVTKNGCGLFWVTHPTTVVGPKNRFGF